MARALLVPALNTIGIRAAVLRSTREVANSSRDLMDATTLTFNRVDPNFLIARAEEQGDIIYTIGPANDRDGRIWAFVNNGTDVQYAIFSDDFEPKTTPRSLVGGSGRGEIVAFSSEGRTPGIEARLFTEVIKEVIEQEWPDVVIKELRKIEIWRPR